MKSWVERRLSCPPTSVEQRGTEREGCIKTYIYYLFIRRDSHCLLYARLYDEKRRFPLFASMIVFGMRGAAARARQSLCTEMHLLLLLLQLRNYRRAVVQFWNRQYCKDATSQWPLLLIIQACAHQRVIFACAPTRERFFSTLHFFRDKCVCACKSGYFEHFMHLLICVVWVKQL